MTLTEDQREAIRAVSDLPRAIGCTQCHSYIQEHYGNQFAVLRSMIDSSDNIPDATKLIPSFDPEMARATLNVISLRSCTESKRHLSEAIAEIEVLRPRLAEAKQNLSDSWKFQEEQAAEIERLQEFRDRVARILKQPLTDCDDLLILSLDSVICHRRRQAARIKELESSLDEIERLRAGAIKGNQFVNELMANCNSLRERIWKAEARIKELEDAHKRSGKKYAKIINELRSSVYANIPGLDVGKIGPDAAKPRSWQITKERVGLLEYCLETLLDAPDIEEIPGPGHSIEVLRAMLTEAGK